MLAVLVNRRARAVLRNRGLPDRLRRQLGGRGELIATEDEEELPEVAVRLFRQGTSVLGLVGGDGTTAVLRALCQAYGAARLPKIALLRGGTVNTVANNFGVRGRTEQLLDRLLEKMAQGAELPSVDNDTIAVNGRVGFLFGAAMGGRFLEAYYEDGPPTAWRAATLSAGTLASIFVWGKLARRLFAETRVRLWVDGQESIIRRPRLLVAATVPDMGVGFRIAWRARQERSKFHLVASELSTFQLGAQSHRVMRGLPLIGQPNLDVLAAKTQIEFAEEEPYTLDGELFRARQVEIVLGPRVEMVRI